jgi:chromosomal replication initiator protein
VTTSTSMQSVCARIAEHLAQSVGSQRYRLWFNGSARLEYLDAERTLRIDVPNRFVADWIGRHFRSQICDAASRELGHEVTLDVRVDPHPFRRLVESSAELSADTTSSHASSHASDVTAPHTGESIAADASNDLHASQQSNQSAATTIANPAAAVTAWVTVPAPPAHAKPRAFVPLRHRLSDYIVGPSNELAFSAANRLVDHDEPGCSPLFIHGACGLGKTHLLQGICRKMLDARPDAKVLYTTGEQFTNEFVDALHHNKIEQFRRRIRKLDLLAVDDIHFIANKQQTQQEFLHSFNAIEMSGARVALASDCHPKLIKQFSDALVSRCVRGMVVEVRPPEFATRCKIIHALADRRGIRLLDSAVEALAKKVVSSVREIEGVLTKVQALASLTMDASSNEPIGHTVLNRLNETDAQVAPRKVVRFDTILTVVCEQLGVTKQQVMGSGRHAQVVLARSLVIHMGRHMTAMSYPEIASALGRGHHSTVITACQRAERLIADNATATLPGSGEQLPLGELIERLKLAVQRF